MKLQESTKEARTSAPDISKSPCTNWREPARAVVHDGPATLSTTPFTADERKELNKGVKVLCRYGASLNYYPAKIMQRLADGLCQVM
jgi:hypothetical protein